MPHGKHGLFLTPTLKVRHMKNMDFFLTPTLNPTVADAYPQGMCQMETTPDAYPQSMCHMKNQMDFDAYPQGMCQMENKTPTVFDAYAQGMCHMEKHKDFC